MTAQYTVKFNGKWYKAGEEIEETQTVSSSLITPRPTLTA